MITHIKYIKAIGQFEEDQSIAALPLSQRCFVYAENGRGKTTLAAILRSLGTGESIHIAERTRLGSTSDPVVRIATDSNTDEHVYAQGQWRPSTLSIRVFDDHFISNNVCSGLEIDIEHRRNMHELVLGERGVQLVNAANTARDYRQACQRAKREAADAFTPEVLHGVSVDDFCALEAADDIDQQIAEAERVLKAAQDATQIANQPAFRSLVISSFSIDTLTGVLGRTIEDIDAEAVDAVQRHTVKLGANSEEWLRDGLSMTDKASLSECPFCQQDLKASSAIDEYRAYFSDLYKEHLSSLNTAMLDLESEHGQESITQFQQALSAARTTREFWSRYVSVPEISEEFNDIATKWLLAVNSAHSALDRKQTNPLQRATFETAELDVLKQHNELVSELSQLNTTLTEVNEAIERRKAQVAGTQATEAANTVRRLKAIQSRGEQSSIDLCETYQNAVAAHEQASSAYSEANDALDEYRAQVMPQYQDSINTHLGSLNAEFKLDRVVPQNNPGATACTFELVIRDHPVRIAGGNVAVGAPSFRTALSAGDRNTLALAFFFASLDAMDNLNDAIIVFDDPLSSLDCHRTAATRSALRRYADRCNQLIVMSHKHEFLCTLWEEMKSETRSCVHICSSATGSCLSEWDVQSHARDQHDERHERLTRFFNHEESDQRDIAKSIRPHLERFVRVAYPEYAPPGTLLGTFLNTCRTQSDQGKHVLNDTDYTELDELNNYAKEFHHETRSQATAPALNETELRRFVARTLEFVRRPIT